ncbi:hypothetical protein EXIGLDRAFT_784604 [Exidia glandulosa HHB12029]|uniref:Uncharacterized protein n=1 Tax=Exidia glandulosa HHB12029 TaxID=1314781 RepID=A0A166MDD9_EXIGL|nr:hypothetical protein EXIGLDRAFT_784604 [Exidia glandulosa HHB12029]
MSKLMLARRASVLQVAAQVAHRDYSALLRVLYVSRSLRKYLCVGPWDDHSAYIMLQDTDRAALLNATVTRRSRSSSAVSEPGICCRRVAALQIVREVTRSFKATLDLQT